MPAVSPHDPGLRPRERPVHAGRAPVLQGAPVAISFVDLRRRTIAPAELRRFVDRLGARSVLDETSRAYRDAGLGYLRMTDAEIADRLLADARLLRLPLVRNGNEVTAGRAEAIWADWLRAPAGA
jgi:arsenate reductase-like glutaredoxin family protein